MEVPIQSLIIYGSLTGILLASGFILFVVSYQKRIVSEELRRKELELKSQKTILEAVLLTENLERKKISFDLHDSLLGTLSSIQMIVAELEDTPHFQEEFSKEAKLLRHISKAAQICYTEARGISHRLHPPGLEREGLVHALHTFTKFFSSDKRKVLFSSTAERLALSMDDQISVFRILQELVHNALIHGMASEVEIRLENTHNSINIIVDDNGVGLDDPNKIESQGLGIHSVNARLDAVNGTIEYVNRAPSGLRVLITIPNERSN